MKAAKLFSLALFLCLGTLAFGQTKAMPSIAVKTLDGKSVDLKDYAGKEKITIYSFWATWCSPCKRELDAIADLYPEWVEKYDVQLVAVTIDTQQSLSQVKPMVASKGWDYVVLSDVNSASLASLNFQTVPQMFVTDKSGNIIYSHGAYVPGDEFELEDKIKDWAKGK